MNRRTILFWLAALPVLYFISRYNYNLFHSLADGVSIIIAASVFMIIWNARRILDNEYFLYVGISFLFFAFLDLMHVLGNKNMGVFPEYGNLGPALYIASRYILSISLLIAPLFIKRKLNSTLMFAMYSLVTLFILLSIFYWHTFPVCIVEGVGLTPFKVISDYIICLILFGAIGLLLINRRSFDSRVFWIVVSSIILSIATGVAFTLYADPFGIMNAVGHFLQIASFYLVYLAIIETSLTKPQDVLYRKLKQSEEKLAENVKQLDYANVELKQEITERKRAEEALRKAHDQLQGHARKLQETNKDLDDFAYTVSHDLRAPLRAINGFARMLTDEYGPSLEEEGKRRLDVIEMNAIKMGLLIDDLLAFSRAGRTAMNVSRLDMNSLVTEAVETLKASHSGAEAAIQVAALPPVQGDHALIRQVLLNLLGNAMKFSRNRPEPRIEVGSFERDGEQVYFVKDNGVGFDMKYYDKLFGVFQRLVTEKEFEGTGVGLAIVQRLITRHGGRVWGESKRGEGATFFFTLNRKEQEHGSL